MAVFSCIVELGYVVSTCYWCTSTHNNFTFLVQNIHRVPPLVGRFVPFVAVMAANMINIPLMRYEELKNGVCLIDRNGNKLGEEKSKVKII